MPQDEHLALGQRDTTREDGRPAGRPSAWPVGDDGTVDGYQVNLQITFELEG